MNSPSDMVFPIQGYTDKIIDATGQVFVSRPWLTFTRSQLTADVIRGLPWLTVELSAKQSTVLNHIISTSIRLLIQRGIIKKVKGPMTVEAEWQAKDGIAAGVYVNLTGDDCVAKNPTKVGNRALNLKQLRELNIEPHHFDLKPTNVV
jgi:hypothetical protein